MATSETRCRIVVVDDSRIFREAVAGALANQPDMTVEAEFESAEKALEYIKTHTVDAVTLDVEMPGMDGLRFLVELQKANKDRPPEECPGIIMVSAHTQKGADITIKALQSGAFDFINKPNGPDSKANQETLKRQLLVKIRCLVSQRSLRICQGKAVGCSLPRPSAMKAASVQIEAVKEGKAVPGNSVAAAEELVPAAAAVPAAVTRARRAVRNVKAILIGVSTGGPKALAVLLPELCRLVSQPILIVQHMPPDFTRSLAESLSRSCPAPVREGLDGEAIESNHVYIAPGGKHMALRRSGEGAAILSLNDQPPENGCRPSVDVLFRTAAAAMGGQTLAIVLTGMGNDGTRGLASLKRAGCYAIAQDEASCVVWGMPGSVVREGLADEVLPLTQIAAAVEEICQRP